jgi:hypothetical protein
MSAKEYREYADECLAWAKKATTDKERRDFLKMAEAWLQAAALLTPTTKAASSNGHAPEGPDAR